MRILANVSFASMHQIACTELHSYQLERISFFTLIRSPWDRAFSSGMR